VPLAQKTGLTFLVWTLACLTVSPVLLGETPLLRQPIPAEGGSAAVDRYVSVAGKLGVTYSGGWAKYHGGFETGSGKAVCLHQRAEFLIWHHAYLVLTEELFGIADGSPFAMPYWSPAEGPKVPGVFWSNPALADASRFPGHPDFEDAHKAYKHLLAPPSHSFFCESAVNPIGGKPRQGAVGEIERLIHDRVHDESISSNGRLGDRKVASEDLFFHPFHAGIDKVFFEYLSARASKCEMCANLVTYRNLANHEVTETWITADLGELPEPQCLILGQSGVQLNTSPDAQYSTLTSSSLPELKRCADLKVTDGIPHRKFLVSEILKAPRFWMRGYALQNGTSIHETTPCTGQTECNNQQTVYCPLNPTSIRLNLPDGVFVPLVADAAEPKDLRNSSFKISVSGLKLDQNSVGAVAIVLRRNRWFSRKLTVGTVKYSGWRASLLAGHEGHTNEGPVEDYVLYPTDQVNEKLARLLAPDRKKSIQVSLRPVKGDSKSLNITNTRVKVEGFVRPAPATTP
jgi:hypothetical protein